MFMGGLVHVLRVIDVEQHCFTKKEEKKKKKKKMHYITR